MNQYIIFMLGNALLESVAVGSVCLGHHPILLCGVCLLSGCQGGVSDVVSSHANPPQMYV